MAPSGIFTGWAKVTLEIRGSDDPQLKSSYDRLGAVRDLELGEDVLDVVFNGAYTYKELFRYLAVGVPVGKQFEDFGLPGCQRLNNLLALRIGRLSAFVCLVGELFEQPSGQIPA